MAFSQTELDLIKYGNQAGLQGDELSSFMAQTAHESAGYTRSTERKYGKTNLGNFQAEATKEAKNNIKRKAAGKTEIKTKQNWVKRLKADGLLDAKGAVTDLATNLNSADQLGDSIFNSIYGGRNDLGNGDFASGDGSTYKGRGIIQLTGRANYKQIGDDIGVDLINNPNLLSTNPEIAAKASLAYWKRNVQSRNPDFSDTEAVTKIVNGGTTGLQDRITRQAKYTPFVNNMSGVVGQMSNQDPLSTPEVPPLTAETISTLGINDPLLGELFDVGVPQAEARVSNLEEQQAAADALRLNQLQTSVTAPDAPGAQFNAEQAASLQQQMQGLQANPGVAPDYNSNTLYPGFDYAPTEVPPNPAAQEVPLEMLTTPPPSPDPRQMSLADQRTYLMANPNIDPRTVLAPMSPVPALYNNGTAGVKHYQEGTDYASMGLDSEELGLLYDAGDPGAIARVELLEQQQNNLEQLNQLRLNQAVQADDSLGAEFNAGLASNLSRNAAILGDPRFANSGPVGNESLGYNFVPQVVNNNDFSSMVAPALATPNMHGMPQIQTGVPAPRANVNTQLQSLVPPPADPLPFSLNNTMRDFFSPIGEMMDNNPLKQAIADGRITMEQQAALEEHFKQQLANQSGGVPGGNVPPVEDDWRNSFVARGPDPDGLFSPKTQEVPTNDSIESALQEAINSPAATDTAESSEADNNSLASLDRDYQEGKITEAIASYEAVKLREKDPKASNTIEENMKKYLGVGFGDITKAVGYYLMSRATGASHEGSMRWAGKAALKGATKDRASEAQIKALVDAGYTEASARSYSATKIAAILEKQNAGSPALKQTGQTTTIGIVGIPGLNNVRGYEVDAGDTAGGKYNVYSLPSSYLDPTAKPGEFTQVTEQQLMALVARNGGQVTPFDKDTDTNAGRIAAASRFTDSMTNEVTQIFSQSEPWVKTQWPVALAGAAQFIQDSMGYNLNDPGVQNSAKVTLLTAMQDMKNDLDSGKVKKVNTATPYIKRVLLTSAAIGPGQIWQTEDGENQVSTTKTNQYWSKLESINKDPAQVKINFKKLYTTYNDLKQKGELPVVRLTSPLSFSKSKTENQFSVWLSKTLNNDEELNAILFPDETE